MIKNCLSLSCENIKIECRHNSNWAFNDQRQLDMTAEHLTGDIRSRVLSMKCVPCKRCGFYLMSLLRSKHPDPGKTSLDVSSRVLVSSQSWVELHSPGKLPRCPEPTWGRIPISGISWYWRSMRSFCGVRPLPACPPRRSGPSPGASSPASSPHPMGDFAHTTPRWSRKCPQGRRWRRGCWEHSRCSCLFSFFFLSLLIHRWVSRFNNVSSDGQTTEHTAKLRGALPIVCG